MVYHFGVRVLEGKRGLKLTREKYAIVNNKSSFRKGKVYDEEWCEKQLKNSLYNFDLNMKYFSLLNSEEFCREITDFIKGNPQFKQVDDLNFYDNKSGYYLMVLDEYSQVYVGTTANIKKRIQQHWGSSKSFDRLIFGKAETSILSIDSFRALDTTRIYAYETNETFDIEDDYINKFSTKFICNRIAGGRLLTGDLLEILSIKKVRT